MKAFSRSELGSILLIVFGFILLLDPDLGSAALATVLGWVLVAVGAVGLILDTPVKVGMFRLGGSILELIGGIWLLKNPLALAKLLGIGLGLLLVNQGSNALRDAASVRSCGGSFLPGTLFGGFMLLAGLGLVFSPLGASRLVMAVAGLVMILCGIGNLISHRRSQRYIRDHETPRIIDAEE